MATESIGLSVRIPASPAEVFAAWLDSAAHTAMTGGRAKIEPRVGGAHTAWDGYITGVTLELVPGERIVQSWRTSEFPAKSPASRLEITLVEEGGGTRFLLAHSAIPKNQGARYKSGWGDHYFEPMIAYFARKGQGSAGLRAKTLPKKPVAKKPAAKKAAARKQVPVKKVRAKVRKPAAKKAVKKTKLARKKS